MEIPFLDLRAQYQSIAGEVESALFDIIERAAFIGGKPVAEFEGAFARYVQVDHCVGVANGTDAIELALEALDLRAGGSVIVPANSFVATSEAVSRVGLVPVFADVSDSDYTLDVDDVAQRIRHDTVAVIAVHLYGHPARLDTLREILAPRGIRLLEDAAQAHGAEAGGRRVGGGSAVGTFSFYPGKNLGAYGDAGAVVCDDPDLAQRIRMLANHGRTDKYDHQFEGRNSRLDALQAAVLSVKLRHLEQWTEHRRLLADRYCERLAEVGDLVLPIERSGCRHVYHLFVVRTRRRDELRDWLRSKGVGVGVHYPVALPDLRAYSSHPQASESFVASRLAGEVLSLPMGDSLSESQVDRVCGLIREFFD